MIYFIGTVVLAIVLTWGICHIKFLFTRVRLEKNYDKLKHEAYNQGKTEGEFFGKHRAWKEMSERRQGYICKYCRTPVAKALIDESRGMPFTIDGQDPNDFFNKMEEK